MNFSAAIQAHANWKLRLAALCQGSSREKIDIDSLAKDNVCELGKWLHGDCRKYASDPKFQELVNTHAAFHRSAAAIAKMAGSGKAAEAEASINSRESEFGKISVQVVGLLMGFRGRYGDA
jgi:hypothetical protein